MNFIKREAKLIILGLIFLYLMNLASAATYYIDFESGSDSNSGLSTAAAWKRAPGMAGFSGAYSHSAGDRFIFKGGVTWPSSALPLTISYSGSAASFDEYATDSSWHNGAFFSRPIFDGDYITQKFIIANSINYIAIDGIEFMRAIINYSDTYGAMPFVISLFQISDWVIRDNYFHDLGVFGSGVEHVNGGFVIYCNGMNNLKIINNTANNVYFHRFAVLSASANNNGFEFYQNNISDVAVSIGYGGNNAYTFGNVSIHDNHFFNEYLPYTDHSKGKLFTQVNGSVSSTQTTINVVNGSALPSGYNFVVQIDDEQIFVPTNGRVGNALNGVTRGYMGSNPQAHNDLANSILRCSDPWHGDYIHLFQKGSGSITDVKVYNNYFHQSNSGPIPPYPCNGTVGSGKFYGSMTAHLYLEDNLISPQVYNNIFEGSNGTSMMVSTADVQNLLFFNNQLLGENVSQGLGIGIGGTSPNARIYNNIFSNIKYMIYVPSANSEPGFQSDNNIFYNFNAPGYIGGFKYSMANWQNALGGCPGSGNDCTSSSANPNLTSDYLPTDRSTNLIDKGIDYSAYSTMDKDGISRPQGAAWDIGAYEYVSAAPSPPAAVCGNSIIEGTEQCDDGNTLSGDGCNATCAIEGGPDTTAPTISSLANLSTNTTITINFTTSEPANSTIDFGINDSLLDGRIENASFIAAHFAVIDSLPPNTTYFYNITLCDVVGNCAVYGYFTATLVDGLLPPKLYIRADANKDCLIDDAELNIFIARWVESSDDVSMDEMMDILRKWLLGSKKYC